MNNWERHLLCWTNWKFWLSAESGPQEFAWTYDQPVVDAGGAPHTRYGSIGDFANDLLKDSTDILLKTMEPAQLTRSLPSGPIRAGEVQKSSIGTHTHTLDVTKYAIHLAFGSIVGQVQSVSISGQLEWQRTLTLPNFYVVEKIPQGEPFAGAAITQYGTEEGKLSALTFDPNSQTIGVHPTIQLQEKHRSAIRQLQIYESQDRE